jgi:hypothetical protein
MNNQRLRVEDESLRIASNTLKQRMINENSVIENFRQKSDRFRFSDSG